MESEIVGLEFALPPLVPSFLVVEDDPAIRKLVANLILGRYPRCETAANLSEAKARLAAGRYDILFLDLILPDGCGSLLLEQSELLAESLVLVITGQRELHAAVQVLRGGAFDFISKPFGIREIGERLDKAVEQWRARLRCRHYQLHLEKLVNVMTEKVLATNEHIEKTYDATVAALGAALDLRDPETEEHCHRVSENSLKLGQAMGLAPSALRNLRWGAYLHDIGKIGIPEHVLNKSSSLTSEEMALVKEHPALGYRMIRNIDFLKGAADVVLYHHEKFDGSGYPHGLKGEDIPIASRIFAVADAVDAMLNDRPYRKALPSGEVAAELATHVESHFDPEVVRVFLSYAQTNWQKLNQSTTAGRR